ncbi:MAG: sugar kinase [Amycolatopsis sp.]|jgi:predicted NBD/HSP70 family sugar kinase|uniref:ROK family transcriptional regulator n=1 Tax=Amycolatopsis sp. TaxID=37632 RepID=UPI002634E145|nr:ROK family transcriptional regulator [Amycolatopsis sp.]MCU1687229.1 sugar kinase [Amycolatopsis sp.]
MTESGVNLRALRKHNRALLLTEIRRAGGLSRVELADRSGLTAQAVSKIVPELIDAGLLDEERQFDGNVGKPRTQLRIRPGARYALGVQLDRDEVHVVLTDLLGSVLSKTTSRLDRGFSPDDAMSAIADGVDQLTSYLDRAKLLGLGVGALGPLDHHTGVVHHATGLAGWHEVSLRGRLAARTGLAVIVDKDTNTAAFAHQWHAARSPVTTALVLVGTGIGVGLLVDGKLYRGPRTNAGEFGHTTLWFEGPLCKCGRRGCVEVMHNSASTPEEAARLLGIGLADLVQVLDLERIVLAGRSIRAAPELYTSTIAAQLAQQLPVPHWQRITVEVSDLGDDLVAIGAAAEVLAAFYADPR